MTVRSMKALVQATSIPEELGPWRSKLLWASRVLPMPLVGLFFISSLCANVGDGSVDYPEIEALSRLDFGAAMKVCIRQKTNIRVVTADVEEKSVIIGKRNREATEALQTDRLWQEDPLNEDAGAPPDVVAPDEFVNRTANRCGRGAVKKDEIGNRFYVHHSIFGEDGNSSWKLESSSNIDSTIQRW
ncbi:hypothetical protein LXL04_020800 [Taraxacum kok-saghyz]